MRNVVAVDDKESNEGYFHSQNFGEPKIENPANCLSVPTNMGAKSFLKEQIDFQAL